MQLRVNRFDSKPTVCNFGFEKFWTTSVITHKNKNYESSSVLHMNLTSLQNWKWN